MSGLFGIPANVVYATAGIYAVLVLASIVVWVMRLRNPGERYAELAARTESWWWMIGAFTLCILFNQTVAIVFLAFISYLALKEYLSLIPTRRIDREVLLFAYLAIPIQFYWAAIDWYGMFIVFVPVWMFLFFPGADGAQGRDARLPARGRHAVLGPDDDGVHAEPHGVAAGVGRSCQPGRGRGGPAVLSRGADPVQRRGAILLGQAHRPPQGDADGEPEKDLGGADRRHRHDHRRRRADRAAPHADGLALVGACRLILGVSGFLGDITLSAVKRDLGVKDTGGLIPGHGGILDRVDSLTYAAPAFVHFIRYFFYP